MVKSKSILGEKNTQTTGPRPLVAQPSASGKRKSSLHHFLGWGEGRTKQLIQDKACG